MRSRNKAFIWLFLLIVIAALFLLLAFRTPGADRWEEAMSRINQLKAEARLRELPRSELRGKLLPGDAWDEYELGIGDVLAKNDDENGGIYTQFANGQLDDAGREKAKDLVSARAGAIEHLRVATQRANGQYPYNWEAAPHAELPSLLGSRKLANLAVAQASIHRENGRPQEAADLLLDTTVFARDLSTNAPLLSHLIGAAVYGTAFTEMKNVIVSGKLSKNQLTELARKLELVEHDLPSLNAALSNETLNFGLAELDVFNSGSDEWPGFIRHDWRMLFFARSRFASAFEEKESYLKRAEKLEQMSYADAIKEANAIDRDAEASSNYLVRLDTPNLSKMLIAQREVLAQLRLIRAAAIFLATGKEAPMPDPFGGNLFFKQEGRKTKIWSVGSDGKNQNGSGEFEKGKSDLVLEMTSPGR